MLKIRCLNSLGVETPRLFFLPEYWQTQGDKNHSQNQSFFAYKSENNFSGRFFIKKNTLQKQP